MEKHVHTEPFGDLGCPWFVISIDKDGYPRSVPAYSHSEGVELAEISTAECFVDTVVLFQVSSKEAQVFKGNIDPDLTKTFNDGFPGWEAVDHMS